jgi:hypothetical protein
MFRVTTVLVWIIAPPLIGCYTSIASEPPLKLKPTITLTGNDSAVSTASIEHCTEHKLWQTLWHQHKKGSEIDDALSCPEVDFDSHFVLAFFAGKGLIPPTFTIHEIVEEPDCVRIRYTFTSGQIIFVPDHQYEETKSYAFVVLPTIKKSIIVEEGHRLRTDEPYGWKERKRFTAVSR